MSSRGMINIIGNKEMSSQGRVNAPVVVPNLVAQVQAPSRQQYETPSGLPSWPNKPMAQAMPTPAPTAQSSVFEGLSGVAPTVPIVGGSVQPSIVPPTIPIDAPSCQETKETSEEVASAFKEMSPEHRQIQGGL